MLPPVAKGIATAKEFAKLMGGMLHAENEVEPSSLFGFEIQGTPGEASTHEKDMPDIKIQRTPRHRERKRCRA